MKNYFKDCKSNEDAKREYKRLAKIYHPDLNGAESSEETMKLINVQFEKFCPTKEGEQKDFSNSIFASILVELIKMEGLEIEICGDWIWIGGNTRYWKDEIKAVDTDAKFNIRFSKNKCKWYFSPVGYKRKSGKSFSMDYIRAIHGSERVQTKAGNLLAY